VTGWRVLAGRCLSARMRKCASSSADAGVHAFTLFTLSRFSRFHAEFTQTLEFTLNNGLAGDKFKEDRPGNSPLYTCPFPGSFKLVKGGLRPFLRGAESRIMLVRAFSVWTPFLLFCRPPLYPGRLRLWVPARRPLVRPDAPIAQFRSACLAPLRCVPTAPARRAAPPQVSDIDGTMIGDMGMPDVFASSARFADYWENSASLSGSLLVYNTGEAFCYTTTYILG
jgi:hypothetical protein